MPPIPGQEPSMSPDNTEATDQSVVVIDDELQQTSEPNIEILAASATEPEEPRKEKKPNWLERIRLKKEQKQKLIDMEKDLKTETGREKVVNELIDFYAKQASISLQDKDNPYAETDAKDRRNKIIKGIVTKVVIGGVIGTGLALAGATTFPMVAIAMDSVGAVRCRN